MSVGDAWSVLCGIERLSTQVLESRYPAHAGRGEGTVERCLSSQTLVFNESGIWTLPSGTQIPFRNRYRWRLEDDALTLAHLRYGDVNPVMLASFVPTGPNQLRARAPHWCDPDTYRVAMSLGPSGATLLWSVSGPAKDYRMRTAYECKARGPSDMCEVLA